MEKWKPVPKFENRYLISNRGRVVSIGFGLVKIQKDKDGYCIYRFADTSKHEETLKIHRLVMRVFGKRGCPKNFEVNHKDGDKTNNRLFNLEICTGLANRRHAVANGLHVHGERSPQSKLTELEVVAIRRLYARGGILQTELAKRFGVGRKCISKIVTGARWKHLTEVAK